MLAGDWVGDTEIGPGEHVGTKARACGFWCVMGIETLYSAAHAAGFAMAAPEEAYEDLQALPMVQSPSPELQWQRSRGVLLHGTPTHRGDWTALLMGLLGRRPPTRRPALTAEA